MAGLDPDDPYSRLNYRRVIAWPERLVRERPLFEEVLAAAPRKSLLDLGCGTGEHAFLLASLGYAVTGIDRSGEQLRAAQETEMEIAPRPRFLDGDLRDLDAALGEDRFGAAVCLGNTLPHLQSRAELDAFLDGLARHLLPGAPFLLQVLNYRRILESKVRALPVNVRPGEREGEEIVFVRLMTPQEDGSLLFNPATLRYRPGSEQPLEVVSARNVRLHPFTLDELSPALEAHGFTVKERWGGMKREAYSPGESSDLVLLTRRS
jgi:SAM-dependent methyltransferase